MKNEYNKLRGKIIEKFKTQKNFSRHIKTSERTLSLKLNGKRQWKQNEILKIIKELNIDESEISSYFF